MEVCQYASIPPIYLIKLYILVSEIVLVMAFNSFQMFSHACVSLGISYTAYHFMTCSQIYELFPMKCIAFQLRHALPVRQSHLLLK